MGNILKVNKIILANPKINSSEIIIFLKKVLKSKFVNEGKQTREFEKKIFNLINLFYLKKP